MFNITEEQMLSFFLMFFRIGAILFTAPLFGSRMVSVPIRTLLSFAIAIVLAVSFNLWSVYEPPHETSIAGSGFAVGRQNILLLKSQGPLGILIAIFKEILLGVAIGYIAQLTFVGIQMAGELVGNELGFGMMRILDPTTQENIAITAEFNMVVSMLVLLATHGHHYILMGIAESFSRIPLAGWSPDAPFTSHINNVFAGVFSTAIRVAIPVMGVVFLTKVAMSIIARTMPQMNIFIVGFPIQIAVGLIAMAVSLPFFIKVLGMLFVSMRGNIWAMFR